LLLHSLGIARLVSVVGAFVALEDISESTTCDDSNCICEDVGACFAETQCEFLQDGISCEVYAFIEQIAALYACAESNPVEDEGEYALEWMIFAMEMSS
jgi:hypothetical protein